MTTLTMRADISKLSAHHKLAAAGAFLGLDHLVKHAPAGANAHIHVPTDIPAGKYTYALTKDDATGDVTAVLTPGVVP